MASSNPFRKSVVAADTATLQGIASPTSTRFPPLHSIDTSSSRPPPTSFQVDISTSDSQSKTSKKVRVLSPPPLSPDSPEWAFSAPSFEEHGSMQQKGDDPFDATSTDDSDREMVSAFARDQDRSGGQAPGNPFSKTLRDLESPAAERKLEQERKEEGHALKAANTARRSLDVNSFKRLLMTGNSGSEKAPEMQEVSLIARDTSDTPEDDIERSSFSDSSTSLQIGRGKKPPPPPSSRHGKSIKLDFIGGQSAPEALASMSQSDMNKPLPPAPVRKSFEDGHESPFDQEAAGKVPDINIENNPASPNAPRNNQKAVPAPPPRRGHARGESKAFGPGGSSLGQQALKNHDENLSRSSSMRSQRNHARHDSHAPAPPPPPRRSHHGSRQSTQIPAGVASNLTRNASQSSSSPALSPEIDTISTPTHQPSVEPAPPRETQPGSYQAGVTKSWAPPPPPARNASVRRPASIRSIDSTSRRVSFEAKPHGGIAPPPPPRRQRGSSRGSIEEPPRRTSMEGVAKTRSSQVPEEEPYDAAATLNAGPTSPQSATDAGKGANILADLDALQREVDALRGKLG
ncbi:uncharacterized protein NECHADRAFT_104351 [Fusarium vanettenii 77-13-4]|uniref:Uncharacterized protein n=1 Tax=Fusarium vanettenii (strain ATCC MYA-4622 / CBS 123669 / FGSC 9596 / NRRL 45880 / 77-13-4) TaxID=660122 RepID=C7Z114_FUSV7|nr:uncharacterized protein NECHADRAFT_104351 [Fusarium vanettenii 77-13-4]EEU42486.1 hypothetical protein NECHADRAFT_104351 [Fusarium vanettenii 77-13-4]